jgi:glycosyltransferase involved in cell wall biosynthesis
VVAATTSRERGDSALRILHIITAPDLGGAQSVLLELTKTAVESGHEAGMASAVEGPLWAELDPGVSRFPLRHLVKQVSPSEDASALLELRRLLRTYKPDILHLHSSKAGVLGRVAAERPLRRRTVYTVHGFDTILKAHRSFLPLERLLQRRCGAIVAVSEYDARNLEANGIGRNVKVIRNGARDWRGIAPRDTAIAKKMRAARASGGAVLSIARLAPPKRFDLFVETARLLPSTTFFWIGNERPMVQTDLPVNVVMLGSLPDAGAYANEADVVVLLSDYEGLPMSILEALSCGCPVVASAVGGIPEAIDGPFGQTVKNEAADAAMAIARYLPGGVGYSTAHPDLHKAARRRYEERFSIAAMARGYQSLYSALVDMWNIRAN